MAQAKYQGKVIAVTGPVQTAEPSGGRGFRLNGGKLKPTDPFTAGVDCRVPDSQAPRAWLLGQGQKVRATGRFDSVDALVVATLVTWVVWASYLVVRLRGIAGRRAAYLALAGFLLVIVVRLALPATHFA